MYIFLFEINFRLSSHKLTIFKLFSLFLKTLFYLFIFLRIPNKLINSFLFFSYLLNKNENNLKSLKIKNDQFMREIIQNFLFFLSLFGERSLLDYLKNSCMRIYGICRNIDFVVRLLLH